MKHSIHRLLLSIGLCLGLSWLNTPSNSYAQATTGHVSGRVTTHDGHPIQALQVQFYRQLIGTVWSQTAVTNTDVNGVYTIDLNPGTYHVQFVTGVGLDPTYQPEYYNNAGTVETATDLVVVAGGNLTGIDAQLENATQVSGKVTDQQGNPLEVVIVEAYQQVSGQWSGTGNATSTDAAGQYLLYLPVPGVYRIGFTSGSYLTQFYKDASTVEAGTDLQAAANAVISGIDARLHTKSTIAGVVTDENGKPRAGVLVNGEVAKLQPDGTVAWDPVDGTSTDQNGRYAVAVEPGKYRFCFDDGFGRYPLYDGQCYKDAPDFDQATVIQVGLDQAITGIDAQLKKAGHISGKVSDANGAPLANVQVTLYSRIYGPEPVPGAQERTTTVTDAQGRYQLAVPNRDFYWVGFKAAGYADQYYADTPRINNATPITVSYQANITGINAQLHPVNGRITGRAADENDKSLGGVQVVAYDAANQAVASDITSADGGYLLLLPAGVYRVGFIPADQQTYVTQYYDKASTLNAAKSITVNAGKLVTGIDAYLPLVDTTSPGDITGKVTNENGQGFSPVDIGAYQLVGQGNQQEWKLLYADSTRSDGTYSVYNLLPGQYRLRFNYRGQAGAYQAEYYDNAATIAAGKDVEVKAVAVTRNIDAQLARRSAVANSALVAVNDTFTVVTAASANQISSITGNVLRNDNLPPGKPLTTLIVDLPTHGHVSLYTDGTFNYTPNGRQQNDRFTYVVSDSVNESSPATVFMIAEGSQALPETQADVHIFLPLIEQ